MGKDKGFNILVVILGIIIGVIVCVKKTDARKDGVNEGEFVSLITRFPENVTYQRTGFYWRVNNINVTLPLQFEFEYNDKIEIRGVYQNGGIQGTAATKLVSASWIDRWRGRWQERVLAWIPGDEGAIAAGILLGGSRGLSREARTNFRNVGITHILAASGYNVTIVAAWILAAASKISGRKWGLVVGMGVIWVYVILAGAGAPVVRAGIMAAIAITGLMLGRKVDAGRILILAAEGMLLWNWEWVDDLGYWLSVASTAGLVWIWPSVESYISKIKGAAGVLASDFGVTVVVSLATAPIGIYFFHQVAWISPLVNAAVLWIVPVVMQITAVAVAVGELWPGAGRIIVWLGWPLLRVMTGLVEMVADWSFGIANIAEFPWWGVGIYYLVLVLGLKMMTKKS